jgi:hypothetical protein
LRYTKRPPKPISNGEARGVCMDCNADRVKSRMISAKAGWRHLCSAGDRTYGRRTFSPVSVVALLPAVLVEPDAAAQTDQAARTGRTHRVAPGRYR